MNRAGQTKDTDNIRIIVAAHRPYWMPEDPIYLPVQVGAEGKADLGYTPDNTGQNISDKNAFYCELTGLYWAWKNLDAEYLGLAHYRRHFVNPSGHREQKNADAPGFLCLTRQDSQPHFSSDAAALPAGQPPAEKVARILTREHAERLLRRTDVLLPKKRHYWIETNYSQYIHAHHEIDLVTTRQILMEKTPEYAAAYDLVMKRTYGHRFNMFIMKRELLDDYCTWLFDILFELERRLDIRDYSPNDQRVFGFVAERLLDVWIEKNQIKYREIPYVFLEEQHWVNKGMAFLKRKVKGGKGS